MGLNKGLQDLLINGGVLAGVGVGIYLIYTNNMFGIQDLLQGVGSIDLSEIGGGAGAAPPPPSGGFEQNYDPNQLPVPAGAPSGFQSSSGTQYPYDIGQQGFASSDPNYPYGVPNIGGTPQFLYGTPGQYSPYGTPSTGVGTIPGTNTVPYPNPCPPGFYRASDLKCYPIPTQFPGSGCGPNMYLANDGRCYNYPSTGVGVGFPPVPCPIGEYRASDGRCYQLPSPPPGGCPEGQYRASDGQCYPLGTGTPPPATQDPCPTGQYRASDGNCYAYPPGTPPPVTYPPFIPTLKKYSMFLAIPQCADLSLYTKDKLKKNWSIATDEYVQLRLRPDVQVCQGCGVCPSIHGLYIRADDSEDYGKGLKHGFVHATHELLSKYYVSPIGSFHARRSVGSFLGGRPVTPMPIANLRHGVRRLNR